MKSDEYAKRYIADLKKQGTELQKFVKTLLVPAGFTGQWKEDSTWFAARQHKFNQYVLTSADGSITFTLSPGGDGSTSFKVADGTTRTFDRTGVESSFYWKAFDYKGAETPVMSEVFKEQLERIEKRREFFKSAVTLPEIGFSMSPEGLEGLKKKLAAGGYYTFTPAGFGTGYNISSKNLRHGRRAGSALEKFLDIGPVFIQSIDCD